MVSVVILANSEDKKFWNAVKNILCRSFKTVCCIGGCLDARGSEAEIVITDGESFDLVYTDEAIVIFRDGELGGEIVARTQSVAIVDSGAQGALKAVSKSKLPAITCGLSQRDTLTLSSIKEDSAVIDLQRSVTCFDGTVAEPQEIPVSLTASIDSFALMCAACVFILTGNLQKLVGASI